MVKVISLIMFPEDCKTFQVDKKKPTKQKQKPKINLFLKVIVI